MSEKKVKKNSLQILEDQFTERNKELSKVLPSGCTAERFIRIVKTAAMQTPALLTAERASLFMSCFKAAQDGLLPDGRESALVIFGNQVTYMPMVAGILKKIRNSGELSSIAAHVVYENDEFDYCLGDEEHIKHKPALSNRGKVVCVYAIVKTKDGAIYREVMSIEEVEKIRNISRAKNSTTWKDHWGEMAKKTVIRRISKRLPMNTDVEQVINRDDEMFEFTNKQTQQFSNVAATINQQIQSIDDVAEIVEDIEIDEKASTQAEELFGDK